DLGFDPVDVLVLDPFRRVPAARPAALVALLPGFREVFRLSAGGKAAGDGKGPDAFDREEIALFVLIALNHTGGTVPIFVIQALRPQIRRLHHVRVRGNNTHGVSSYIG